MCKIVGRDEVRRPKEEIGRTPRLEVVRIQWGWRAAAVQQAEGGVSRTEK